VEGFGYFTLFFSFSLHPDKSTPLSYTLAPLQTREESLEKKEDSEKRNMKETNRVLEHSMFHSESRESTGKSIERSTISMIFL